MARARGPQRPAPRPPARRPASPPAVRPLEPAPALAIAAPPGRGTTTVVVADLHLGLGASPKLPLGPPTASAPELAEQLVRLCRRAGARRLVVAGDVKHPIVGAPPWLRPVLFDVFATVLAEGVVPHVVLGNHDVGLARYLPREVVVRPASGIVVHGVGIFHGHRWPSRAVLAAPTLVAGHLHPGYRFAPTADAPDGKQKVWLRADLRERDGVRDRDGRRVPARELVVLPAFHPLAGTEALNRARPERGRTFLYGRLLAHGAVRAYLLDGTDLGALAMPLRPAARAAPRPAPPAP